MRLVLLTTVATALVALPAAAGSARTPDAVVVRLTEADANLVLRGAFRAKGGPVFAGRRDRVSRGVHGLSYEVRLSEPVLALGRNGTAALTFDILEADVTIARIERKILGQRARCEGAGLFIEPGHPLALALDLGFVVEEGDVRVVPIEARSPGAREAIHLVKPERCRNTVLPKWLLWGLGKSHLKRHVAQVDRLLLKRAKDAAAGLAEDGLVREEWEIGSTRFRLDASRIETDDGALTVAFDGFGEAGAGGSVDEGQPQAVPPVLPVGESAVAVSERLVNVAIGAAFEGLGERARRPAGDFRRLVRSDAVLALVPGLRNLETREGLLFRMRLDAPPRVRFRELALWEVGPTPAIEREPPPTTARAVVEIEIENVALDVMRATTGAEPEHLGTLTIETGLVRAVPFVNRIGGIAFEPLENSWRLSATGIDFDEPLLAATIQELVFGALFETRFEPIAPGGWRVGDAQLAPRAISVIEGYLVITLGDAAPPPDSIVDASATRTDTLRVSR